MLTRSWSTAEIALDNWRNALHQAGIYVFKDQFRDSGFSGFCLYDEQFPIIYVNNTTPKTRQIFTLFHELAHLLFDTSGIDGLDDEFVSRLPTDSQKIEVISNHFAAEFLVPQAVFEQAFAGLDATEESAAELASDFGVSRELIYRLFLDRGLVSRGDYQTAAKKWADEAGRGGTGGDYYYNIITYRGRPYMELVFREYYQNRIDDVQAAEYLDVTARNLSALESYYTRGGG
jgi:Zn-dependent peptidase ImmA (M78 family)